MRTVRSCRASIGGPFPLCGSLLELRETREVLDVLERFRDRFLERFLVLLAVERFLVLREGLLLPLEPVREIIR
jgi:hypothetical protein